MTKVPAYTQSFIASNLISSLNNINRCSAYLRHLLQPTTALRSPLADKLINKHKKASQRVLTANLHILIYYNFSFILMYAVYEYT